MEDYTVDMLVMFVKTTSLSRWFDVNVERFGCHDYEGLKQRCAREREVQLVVQCCIKRNKVFCRIKCPINPLPVVGWFETPSVSCLKRHLEALGWRLKCVIPTNTLK